ncbi:MAG: hypothetical protein SFU86_12235 [Pirellulaceae bacterium]|nr:hypothetical protein [Pirellulaceae bacterium]
MFPSRSVMILTILTLFALGAPLAGEEAASPAKPATPAKPSQFGINPAGITSPEMRDALQRLHAAGVIPGRRGSLAFFRWTSDEPPKLAHLGLRGANFDDELLALVAHLPDLEFVSLYETNITDEGIKSLAGLRKLRSLAISPINRYEKAGFGPPQWSYPFLPRRDDRPRITGQSLPVIAGITTLESLQLLDARVSAGDLRPLAELPKLSSLALPNVIDDDTIKHLQPCRRLNSLTLGERAISADEIARLADLKSIRHLILIHAQLDGDALQAPAKLDSLEELQLEDCGLTDERLAQLRVPLKLSHLSLERNEIAGSGLSHLVKFELKSLALEFNNLSDDTLVHLPQLGTLESLGIGYNVQVTDRGIASGQLQMMANLKSLRLRGLKSITDTSLPDLLKFGHLEHINIRETKTSPECVAQLKQGMPKTVVFK